MGHFNSFLYVYQRVAIRHSPSPKPRAPQAQRPQVLIHLLQQGELSSVDVLLKGQAVAWPNPVGPVEKKNEK